MTTPAVLLDIEDGLATVTFSRPRKKNALDQRSWNELDEILTRVVDDPSVRALVLTGAGAATASSGGSSFEEAIEAEARVQHIAQSTDDMAEGIQAFLERREPRFTGT
jgi:enoyl-CoA hydratase/carnithine racemase